MPRKAEQRSLHFVPGHAVFTQPLCCLILFDWGSASTPAGPIEQRLNPRSKRIDPGFKTFEASKASLSGRVFRVVPIETLLDDNLPLLDERLPPAALGGGDTKASPSRSLRLDKFIATDKGAPGGADRIPVDAFKRCLYSLAPQLSLNILFDRQPRRPRARAAQLSKSSPPSITPSIARTAAIHHVVFNFIKCPDQNRSGQFQSASASASDETGFVTW